MTTTPTSSSLSSCHTNCNDNGIYSDSRITAPSSSSPPTSSHNHRNKNTNKNAKEDYLERNSQQCYVSRLFRQLYSIPSLHTPSTKTRGYRSKITYNLPLVPKKTIPNTPTIACGIGKDGKAVDVTKGSAFFPAVDYEALGLSPLAENGLNDVCLAVDEWNTSFSNQRRQQIGEKHGNQGNQPLSTKNNEHESTSFLFREVMAKSVRDGSTVVRITIQKTNCYDDEWNNEQQESFRSYLTSRFPSNLKLIVYNTTHDRSRPPKGCILTTLYRHPHYPTLGTTDGDNGASYLVETVPYTDIPYRISPETFCESNHGAETQVSLQTIQWLLVQRGDGVVQPGGVLLVSGRDVSSFGLGFGSLSVPIDNNDNDNNGNEDNHEDNGAVTSLSVCSNTSHNSTTSTNATTTQKLFSETVIVQHCPNVHKDALANFTHHSSLIRSTVLHGTKDDMAEKATLALDGAVCRVRCSTTSCHSTTNKNNTNDDDAGAGISGCPDNKHHVPITVVCSGGRKGFHPSYLNLLCSRTSIRIIIYNSCCTKSLVNDVGWLMRKGGFVVDGFRSFDFFVGTAHQSCLVRLVRRQRGGGVLVLPIGPAGVGKSTLARALVECGGGGSEKRGETAYLWLERDRVFQELKDNGMSMGKCKVEVHRRLLAFLRGETDGVDGGDGERGGTRGNNDGSLVRIVDSTNGNVGARALYVRESRAATVVLVELKPSSWKNLVNNNDNDHYHSASMEEENEETINFLLSRTRDRLQRNDENNDDNYNGFVHNDGRRSYTLSSPHPSFPSTVESQREKHRKILRGITYPTPSERIVLEGGGGGNGDGDSDYNYDENDRAAGSGIHRTTVVHSIQCDPRDVSRLDALPFEVFLVYSTTGEADGVGNTDGVAEKGEYRLRELLLKSYQR